MMPTMLLPKHQLERERESYRPVSTTAAAVVLNKILVYKVIKRIASLCNKKNHINTRVNYLHMN